jgi:large subunit ribosomal protein L3
MIKGLIGTKINMSQKYDSHGRVITVTKIKIYPNYIVAIKETDKDGYKAVRIGSLEAKKVKNPQVGIFKKAGLNKYPKVLREVSFEGEVKLGEEITLDKIFRKGILVDVAGVSKGKGFAGVVKRWGFSGGPRTHGQSDRERAPGSIGATTTPGRVYKGLKMAGHLGNKKITVQGLEVIEVDKEENELLVKGSVPGSRGGFLLIEKATKKKKAYIEPEILEGPVVAGAKEDQAKESSVDKEEPISLTPIEGGQSEKPEETGE